MALQYPLPFSPPLAWWEARDAAIVRDWLIDRALWVATLDTRWLWSTRGDAHEAAPAAPIQLEFALWRPLLSARHGATPDDANDEGADADDTASREPPTSARDAVPSPEIAWAQIEHIARGLRERGVQGWARPKVLTRRVDRKS